MKNLLVLLSLLLTSDVYCNFDTIKAEVRLHSVKNLREGTSISQYSTFSLDTGNYVLLFQQFPDGVPDSMITILEAKNLKVTFWEQSNEYTPSISPYNYWEEVVSIEKEIKELHHLIKQSRKDEKELMHEQELLEKRSLSIEEALSLKQYFQDRFNALFDQQETYFQQLSKLRKELQEFNTLRTGNKKETLLYIHVVAEYPLEQHLLINYLLPPSKETITIAQSAHEKKGNYQLSGVLLDKESGLPVIAASIELLKDEESILFVSSNNEGEFSLQLPVPALYELVIRHRNYRKEKIDDLYPHTDGIALGIIPLKTKYKPSGWEIMSYAIPVIDLMSNTFK